MCANITFKIPTLTQPPPSVYGLVNGPYAYQKPTNPSREMQILKQEGQKTGGPHFGYSFDFKLVNACSNCIHLKMKLTMHLSKMKVKRKREVKFTSIEVSDDGILAESRLLPDRVGRNYAGILQTQKVP